MLRTSSIKNFLKTYGQAAIDKFNAAHPNTPLALQATTQFNDPSGQNKATGGALFRR